MTDARRLLRRGSGLGWATWAAVAAIVLLLGVLASIVKVTIDRQSRSEAEIAALRQQLRRATSTDRPTTRTPRIEREVAPKAPPSRTKVKKPPQPTRAQKKERSTRASAQKKSRPSPSRSSSSRSSSSRTRAAKEVPKADAPRRVEKPSTPPVKRAVPAAAVAAQRAPKCPSDMTFIEGGSFMMGVLKNDPERNFGDLPYTSTKVSGVCIDTYEFPNRPGVAPSARVTWADARSLCRQAGKRLCKEREWERACKGSKNNRYAYGQVWNPVLCNTEDADGNDRDLAKTGAFERCRSTFGVLDLAGNVAEWTSTPQGKKYIVKGGGADRPGYDSRCAARSRKRSNYASDRLGFRCCKDPT